LIGGFIEESSEMCYVLEDELSMCGFVIAAVDANILEKKLANVWIQKMKEKYPDQEEKEDVPDLVQVLSSCCDIVPHFY
jgi:protein O-GlcNAcase/histone acetyltransferase